jgi:hypothetical protein
MPARQVRARRCRSASTSARPSAQVCPASRAARTPPARSSKRMNAGLRPRFLVHGRTT